MSKWSMKEKGSISLEACIVVPMFIFLMLFMYSFFSFFIARNEIGHAVLATAKAFRWMLMQIIIRWILIPF